MMLMTSMMLNSTDAVMTATCCACNVWMWSSLRNRIARIRCFPRALPYVLRAHRLLYAPPSLAQLL